METVMRMEMVMQMVMACRVGTKQMGRMRTEVVFKMLTLKQTFERS